MYLVVNGRGEITHEGKSHILTPGKLILVPNFTNCNYSCDRKLEMIYVLFFNQLHNEIRMFNYNDRVFETNALKEDENLLERLIELHPDKGLLNYDPKTYDNWNYLEQHKSNEQSKPLKESFESQGILLQLFSRFSPLEVDIFDHSDVALKRIYSTLRYINENLEQKLSVDILAKEICLSPDYFSRLFLKVTQSRPIEYIQRKRVEKAQMLLVTTNYSLEEIAELTGLNNSSYLARLFKRYTGKSPGKYRYSKFV
ncbi:MAG: AraC family transcriptional regulator [Desulfobacterales bacterium]|nr:AraC family transcriptional regulator [Desulfobacterales bacterium]